MARYRILSVDGGGIRGIISLVLLERLSARPGLSGFLSKADLLCGTSTGGLVALGLAAGFSLARLRQLYEARGGEIFDDSFLDDARDLGKVVGADYSIANLETILAQEFGKTKRLRDLGKRVLIPAFDLDSGGPASARTWKPKLFHNFPRQPDTDRNELVYQVGCRTCAAPTFFEAYQGYVDGGVYANNPSMCALAQALDARQGPPARLGEVVLFSLGTGTALQFIRGRSLDWGYGQWARPLVSLMLDGSAGVADFQCRQILGDRYSRLAPAFPPEVNFAMDEWRRVPEMIAFAEGADIAAAERFLRERWLG